ncbi:C39 family peptidase [Actinocorallia sp. A-T 12471]|uniref:C39 family peptidase n=1 Tax=Actinocorallia sp. A-T 12471 TaxID=3089813 RepID=UPI0029D14E5E|nr:C39 family peptidase [Actinocorallia sp. A-T 12471]MDX6741719.1 C39 family peptidase [Actinocorallia sp. A-T 12471]
MNKVLASLVPGTALIASILVVPAAPAVAAARPVAVDAVAVSAVSADSTAKAVAASPARITLDIKKVFQSDPLWCNPAGSSISLGTMGISVSQRVLAKKMKTKAPAGTYDNVAVKVLNSYAARKGYAYTLVYDVDDPAKLAERVIHNVGVLRKAVPLQVYMRKLPWYKGQISKGNPGHIIVAYGYNKKNKTIKVWDPYNYYFTGGTHTIKVKRLAKATQSVDNRAGMFYLDQR